MLIKTDKDTIQSYFEDTSNLKGGWADEVVFPGRVEDVSSFLKEASRSKLPVTVSGGGTSTTGARVPMGGAVISMERFDKILDMSKDASGAGSANVQAGVSVEELKSAAFAKGLFYPCHPTEKTALVGGTVATNASGSRSFRYGPTRNHVKALKIVLPTGEITRIKRGARVLRRGDSRFVLPGGRAIDIPIPTYKMPPVKNSAGYYAKDGMDLIDLFIGQEGTLCVLVEAEMSLLKKPDDIFSCFAFFRKEEDSWDFVRDAKTLEPLSIEYFDHSALGLLRSKGLSIPARAAASIFFEKELGEKGVDEIIEDWQNLFKKYGVSEDETWAAMTEKEAERFVEFRHSIPSMINEKIRASGFQKISLDIAVPEGSFLKMMRFYADSLRGEGLESVIFGHIGENHVHTNILPRSKNELVSAKRLALKFIKKGVALGGTVSAEHGIGKLKHAYLEELYGSEGVAEMARIKKAFDPAWILGLDNIFSRDLGKEA